LEIVGFFNKSTINSAIAKLNGCMIKLPNHEILPAFGIALASKPFNVTVMVLTYGTNVEE
jgi:hypothetical protein